MNALRFALSFSAGVAILAACSGSQPPIGAPGAMPQSRTIATRAERGGSWMLPEAKNDDLLYASNQSNYSSVLVFSYPKGKLVGTLTGFSGETAGLCSDASGDVFVTAGFNSGANYIYRYSHGSTEPSNILVDNAGNPNGCAVDPTTGNLAVANYLSSSSPSYVGNVAIYQGAQGNPTVYSDPSSILEPTYCAFDNSGNLFVDDRTSQNLAELPPDSSSFVSISLSGSVWPGSLQWSDGYLVMSDRGDGNPKGKQAIYKVSIAGSSGTLSAPIYLLGRKDRRPPPYAQFAVVGKRIIGPQSGVHGNVSTINFWPFPKGGNAKKTLHAKRVATLYGVAISLASPPSR